MNIIFVAYKILDYFSNATCKFCIFHMASLHSLVFITNAIGILLIHLVRLKTGTNLKTVFENNDVIENMNFRIVVAYE